MANIFDQFDAPPAAQKPVANAFDRFDASVSAGEAEQPWYGKLGQAADDIARIAANGLTFGYADKIAGTLGGGGAEQERALTQAARGRAGSAGTAAEIGSAVAVPLAAGKAGVTLAGRFGTSAMEGLSGLLSRSALMGAEGAGYGALTAAGNDQDIATGAALGALGGSAGNVIGEGVAAVGGKIAGMIGKPAAPTIDDTRQAAQRAYQAADNAGVVFAPQGIQRLSTSIKNELANFGYHPQLQPRVAATLNEVERLAQGNVTLKGLDQLRRIANNARMSNDPSEQKIAGNLIRQIDDFIENAAGPDVLAGNSTAGAAALNEARDLWRRVRKAETVQDASRSAELRAASTGSGANVDNATRQNMRRVLENEPGFTSAEQELIETIVRGSPGQNALRLAGKFAPTGVVSGVLSGGAGLGLAGPVGLALPLAGAGAKAAADRMTQNNVGSLVELILSGAPPARTPAQQYFDDGRDTLIRLIMGASAHEAGSP